MPEFALDAQIHLSESGILGKFKAEFLKGHHRSKVLRNAQRESVLDSVMGSVILHPLERAGGDPDVMLLWVR